MRTSPLLLLLTAAVTMLPAGATLPLGQNDAGSGRDAGDGPNDAIPIGDGTYAGQVGLLAADQRDAYSYQGNELDIIHFNLQGRGTSLRVHDPDGAPYADGSAGTTNTLALNRTGVWTFVVSSPNPSPVAYIFTVSKERLPAGHIQAAPRAWHVWEMAWDEPGDVFVQLVSPIPAKDLAQTQAVGAWLETYWVEPDGLDGYLYVSGGGGRYGGTGTRIEMRPPGLSHDTDIRYGYNSQGDRAGLGWLRITGAANATVRVAQYSDGGGPASLIVAHSSSVQITIREEKGDSLYLWKHSDPSGEAHIFLPGLFVAGEREFEFNAPTRFWAVGDFREGGWYEAPNGEKSYARKCGVNQGAYFTLMEALPGRWRFHMNATASANEFYNLAGGPLPALGLFERPPWVQFNDGPAC